MAYIARLSYSVLGALIAQCQLEFVCDSFRRCIRVVAGECDPHQVGLVSVRSCVLACIRAGRVVDVVCVGPVVAG